MRISSFIMSILKRLLYCVREQSTAMQFDIFKLFTWKNVSFSTSELILTLIMYSMLSKKISRQHFEIFLAHLSKAQDELLSSLAVCRLLHVVRPSTSLNNFSVTTGPIFFKLHVEPSVGGGLKIYINGHGLFIKMAAMPIYGKNT